MKIYCPHCFQEYDVEKESLGKKGTCEVCKETIIIEMPVMQICSKCHRKVYYKETECPDCGNKLKKEAPTYHMFRNYFLSQTQTTARNDNKKSKGLSCIYSKASRVLIPVSIFLVAFLITFFLVRFDIFRFL